MAETLAKCEIDLASVRPVLDEHGLVAAASSTASLSAVPERARGAIVVDSRKIRAGDCFIALRGTVTDAHQYLPLAIEAKAGMLIVERPEAIPPGCAVPYLVVRSGRAAWSYLAAHACGDPQDQLTILGVTGTNGKTSTAWMTGELVRGAGLPCLTIGTLGGDFGDGPRPTAHTTPDPDVLFPLLRSARNRGIRYVAMEASSHAVSQEKLVPIRFAAMAFTSFSRDHLDFHGTFADYFAAKERLFTQLSHPDARRILWEGMPEAADIARHGGDVWYYGHNADRFGTEYLAIATDTTSFAGTSLSYRTRDRRGSFTIPYFGKHAIENFCAAYLLATSQLPAIRLEGLAKMRHVPGRLQRVSLRADEPQVVVDYAHTPDGLEKTLEVLRPLCKGRLAVVFGCGGDRDRGKRPLMGQVAERLADKVYMTSDNPRSEDPGRIIADIAAGLSAPNQAITVVDRRAAIVQAVVDASPDDTVLVAGKGHETYQIIGKTRIAFDDCEVVKHALAARSQP